MNLLSRLSHNIAKKASHIKSNSIKLPEDEVKARHKKAQQLAYQCALDISKEMKEGWSEKQTARLMDTYLKDHGVRSFFHKSFAWFGDRAAFKGFKTYFDFLPSNRRLKATDIVILDTAPVVQGFAGDIGYTCSLTPDSQTLKTCRETLMKFRRELPELFSSDKTPAEICQIVDEQIREMGFLNCHAKYPFSVLGHRLHKMPLANLPGILIPFSVQTYMALVGRGLYPELFGPHHHGEKLGLWAIEPHLGTDQYGFKFEEILVVEKDKAYWLDNDVPHNLDNFGD